MVLSSSYHKPVLVVSSKRGRFFLSGKNSPSCFALLLEESSPFDWGRKYFEKYFSLVTTIMFWNFSPEILKIYDQVLFNNPKIYFNWDSLHARLNSHDRVQINVSWFGKYDPFLIFHNVVFPT